MESRIVQCKRFWVPRGQPVVLASDGFLLDPESDYGKFHSSHALPFESISRSAVLGLLGEPGIGKSTALEHQRALMRPSVEAAGDQLLSVDLGIYGTDALLSKKVFESPEFLEWKGGANRLHLFLDSLDECLVHINTVVGFLTDIFASVQHERLVLRIICRTANWPPELEVCLKRLWGDEGCEIYELAPLRRQDARHFCDAHGVPPDKFLKEVDRLNIATFANKPLTLTFLLDSFQHHYVMPSRKAELYRAGCHILCDEWRERRRKAQRLSAGLRFAIACRLAAAVVFCGRTAIWRAPLHECPSPGDVRADELLGGDESFERENVQQIDRSAIEEAFATGLFRSRGEQRLGFSHQTYTEYLAAQYLVTRRVAVSAILRLILHQDGSGKVVPQLRDTAAWLAAMVPDVFGVLVQKDVSVILSADCANASSKDQVELLRQLLRQFDEGILTNEYIVRSSGLRLTYIGLADDLKLYICDRQKCIPVRRVAITIAELSNQASLLTDIVNVALDEDESHDVRVTAASTVGRLGDESAKASLKRLATDESVNDPDDELRGCALIATWPNHLTAGELFAALRPLKMPDVFGSYQTFLRTDIAGQIQGSAALDALRWARDHNRTFAHQDRMGEVAENLIARTIDFFAEPGVTERLAELLAERAREHFHRNLPILERLSASQAARRAIATAALGSAPDLPSILMLVHAGLVTEKDITFLLDMFVSAGSAAVKEGLGIGIAKLLPWADPESFDRVLVVAQADAILRPILRPYLDQVELGSPEAEYQQAGYEMRRRLREQISPFDADPSPLPEVAPRIDDLLAAFDRGADRAFGFMYLRVREYIVDSPNATFPGWKNFDLDVRRRLLDAARSYLQPDTDRAWLPCDFLRMAGYWALRLLHQEAPQVFASLSAAVWQEWMPSVFANILTDWTRDQAHGSILKTAYSLAPKEFLYVANLAIDWQAKRHKDIFMLNQLTPVWSDDVASLLRSKLPCKERVVFEKALSLLIERGDEDTVQAATQLVSMVGPTTSEADLTKAAFAACQLLFKDVDSYWDCVWSAAQIRPDFAAEVLQRVATNPYGLTGGLIAALREDRLAEVYLWLARHSNELVIFKQQMIAHLADRGTREAFMQIRRIKATLPDEPLQLISDSVEELLRRNTWIPLTPRELLDITGTSETPIARGEFEIASQAEPTESLASKDDSKGQAQPGAPESAISEPDTTCVFHKDGGIWTLSYGGKTVHVNHLRGMEYIAELLRRPGTEIEATALVGTLRRGEKEASGVPDDMRTTAQAAFAGIEMADTKAIKMVKAEIAKRRNDLKDAPPVEQLKIREELSRLQAYLRQVEDRRGKSRIAGGAAQRSRSSVTHAINRAINKIAENHPALGNHLENSVSTGTILAYMPAEIPSWQF